MKTDYEVLIAQLQALMETEPNEISVMSNASALLMEALEQVNWAGFYLVMDGQLKVGPFQGRPACVLIDKGRGVCGTAWAERRTLVVADVEEFPGHIACSSLSRSEIVTPVFRTDGRVAAVIDIDSTELATFDEVDALYLEKIAKILTKELRY